MQDAEDIFPGWPLVGGAAEDLDDNGEPTSSRDEDDEAAGSTSEADDDDDAPASTPEEALSGRAPRSRQRATEEEDEEEEEPSRKRERDGRDQDDTDSRRDTFERLLQKYGGDTAKLADAYFEQANSTSRTAKENKDLRVAYEELLDRLDALEGRAEAPREKGKVEEEPAPEELDHDLKWLTTELKSLSDEKTALTSRQDKILELTAASDREIAKAEARIELAPDEDKPRRMAEHQRLVDAHNTMVREFKDNKGALRSIDRETRTYEREKSIHERRLEADKQTRQQAEENKVHFRAQERTRFDTFTSKAFKLSGLPSDMKDDFIEDLNARCIATLRAIQAKNPNAPAIDLEALVAREAEKVRRLAGGLGKQNFTRDSRKKLEQDAALRKGRDPARAARSAEERPQEKDWEKDAQYWKRRARKMAGVGSD